MTTQHEPVAVLYQGNIPPSLEGIRKPMKPGGYSDSSADIAYALQTAGISVVLPAGAAADPSRDTDWCFPDTDTGIAAALAGGATTLWANTVLYEGHPIGRARRSGIRIIGQPPELVQIFDDKFYTNGFLSAHGLPVVPSLLVERADLGKMAGTETGAGRLLEIEGLRPPVIVKPLRGRGSEGVLKADDIAEFAEAVQALLAAETTIGGESVPAYGDAVMIEPYLPGNEVTITVLPPGNYRRGETEQLEPAHWALPPVLRFNHRNGIAPYNGTVAVTRNSRVIDDEWLQRDSVRQLMRHCERAAALVGARAPIRIDCRESAPERWMMFDLNLKPNMTGPGRPGREDQSSLTAIAARSAGWSYPELAANLARQSW